MYTMIEEILKDNKLLSLKMTTQFFWGKATGIKQKISLEPVDTYTESILKEKFNNLRVISPWARDILVKMGFRVIIELEKRII